MNVTGDVTVPAGQTLTIEPGTLVLLDGDPVGGTGSTEILVQGTIQSQGTEASPVTAITTEKLSGPSNTASSAVSIRMVFEKSNFGIRGTVVTLPTFPWLHKMAGTWPMFPPWLIHPESTP